MYRPETSAMQCASDAVYATSSAQANRSYTEELIALLENRVDRAAEMQQRLMVAAYRIMGPEALPEPSQGPKNENNCAVARMHNLVEMLGDVLAGIEAEVERFERL